MYKPDKYLDDVLDAYKMQYVQRKEAVKAFKRIRTSALKSEADKLKRKLIAANGCCKICGFDYRPVLQLHHILPISEFGNNDDDNIICVCPNCHKTLHCLYTSINKNRDLGIAALSNNYSGTEIVNLLEVVNAYIYKKIEVSEYCGVTS